MKYIAQEAPPKSSTSVHFSLNIFSWFLSSSFWFYWSICCPFLFQLMEQGARVGLYFINRPEWIVVDHACAAYSFITVPLYDTLGTHLNMKIFSLFFWVCKPCLLLIWFSGYAGPDAVKFAVNHATVQAIFCVPQTLNTVSLFWFSDAQVIYLPKISSSGLNCRTFNLLQSWVVYFLAVANLPSGNSIHSSCCGM